MSDAMERNCDSCVYHSYNDCFDVVGACSGVSKHKFPEEANLINTSVDKIKEALPNSNTPGTINPVYIERHTKPMKEKFSLDKLIDDHWNYVEEMLLVHGTEDAVIAIVGFHYKSAFRHGFKHCMEHYGIEEKNDD